MITFRTLAAAGVELGLACPTCRLYCSRSPAAYLRTPWADVDLAEAWARARFRCDRCNSRPSEIRFYKSRPEGGSSLELARWHATAAPTPFNLGLGARPA